MNGNKRLYSSAVVLVVALSTCAARAETNTWIYPFDESQVWNDATNWSSISGGVPDSSDLAMLDKPPGWFFDASPEATFPDPLASGPIISAPASTGSLFMKGAGLTIAASGSLTAAGDLIVGNTDFSENGRGGPGPGGMMVNHGTGSSIFQLQVGKISRGTLDMMGGLIETQALSVGRDFGIGKINLNGGTIYSFNTTSQNMIIHTHAPNQSTLLGGSSWINFAGGTLVTRGDWGWLVDAYKEIDLVGTNGGEPIIGADTDPKMIAFGGAGTVEWSYDPLAAGGLGETTIWGAPGLLADFNADTVVDGTDFLLWQQDFGTIYDATDLTNWEAEFGASMSAVGAGVAAAVPEPSTLLLLVFGLFFLGRFGQRTSPVEIR